MFRTHMEPGFEHVSEATIETVMGFVLREIGVKAAPTGELVLPVAPSPTPADAFREFAAGVHPFPTGQLATATPPPDGGAIPAAPQRASGKRTRGPKRTK